MQVQQNLPGTSNPPFRELIQTEISRRGFIRWASAGAGVGLLTANCATTTAVGREEFSAVESSQLFNFKSVPISSADAVVVPEGYVAEVLYRWGDPINGHSPVFKPDASNSADDQQLQAGMGHDGMEYFSIPGVDPNQRGLLVLNHEYTDQILLFRDGLAPLPPEKMPLEKVRKSMASHGVSVVEIQKDSQGVWQVIESNRCRRITADTPARIAGPAESKLGKEVRGTVNNCAAGRTPWGTYLTCEENIQQVFGTNDPSFMPDERQQLYGLNSQGFTYKIGEMTIPGFRWWEQFNRFDVASPNNDSERFGYVVEIDPQDPSSTPVKRTALGRFRHENAELTLAADGRVVVYMGDDEMNQFIYKFVSKGRWQAGDTSGQALLDEGTLYVAKFEEAGRGIWLELAPGKNGIPQKQSASDSNGFDDADICIYTRLAAKLAGATPMDRPEWLAVHPHTGHVFVSLTNNKSRTDPNPANPRVKNIFGHIIRWSEHGNDPTATEFHWSVFVQGGNPNHSEQANRGSMQGDFFACPDGLKFDSSGILWIQTDMSSSVMGTAGYEELGHNAMLAADPMTGLTRRFLTGPRGCEITGMAMTPDRRAMFINIQHPGEPADDLSDIHNPQKYSSWPDGPGGGRPRSATIVVRRKDQQVIGS
jgi:uncharacterized protein